MASKANPDQTEQQRKNAAYGAAVARLKDANRSQYNALVTEEMAKVGITWAPRLTDEEKAAAKLAEIYEQFPDLAPKA